MSEEQTETREELIRQLHGMVCDKWDMSETLLGLSKLCDPRFNIDEVKDMAVMDAPEILQRGVARVFELLRKEVRESAERAMDVADKIEKLIEQEGGSQ